ncbi:transposase [Neobacillus sp.]|uniref:transposase n=1 Tax=Neobacillus sp. TaxID=2675273 RepID=UPI002898479D|nr:transposase [Neobacillus sp.]
MTNLTSEEFDTDEISWLYNLRWGIETNYHYLKESMKITNISSSKEELIKQDIYSQMYVFNLLQTVQNEAEKEIVQENYKHKMKININMAVGYIKRYFIVIMLREEPSEWEQLYNRLHNKILKEIVPIRKGRKYERTTCSKNRHHINKRKAFNG